ncbi:MAG: VWA domain-containing protein [Corynebacteriales bacterium]|nr:VWA domain-containing protein [Mycobacteriales bacterium]
MLTPKLRVRAALSLGGVVAMLLALVALPVPAAQAKPTETPSLAPVMLVLDASGSMNEPDPSGGTKMEAARKALKEVIDGLPKEAKVGLTVYGSKVDTNAPGACQDIEIVSEVGALDATSMKGIVDGLTAQGSTPIGSALQKANEGLPKEGPRSMVLISDGIDTCAPPEPCQVASDLAGQGVDLTLHAVGFDVDDAAREQLRCIADAGRGQYVDVTDAETLKDKLPILTEKALRSYEAQGIPVTGTETKNGAPELQPGQYLDTLNSSETRYYTLTVPQGMTVYAAATQIRPSSEGSGGTDATYIDLKLINRDDEECANDREVTSDSNWEAHNTAAVSSEMTKDERCYNKDGKYYLRIERGTSARSLGERQVEIMVAYELPVTKDQGESPKQVVELGSPSNPGQYVAGGSSFNDATELTGSGIYTDQVRFGEMLVYKVPLQWGQGLAYQVHYGNSPDSGSIANVETELYNPMRQTAALDVTDTTAYTGTSMSLKTIATPYVYHGNRKGDGAVGMASVAGNYYITVKLAHDAAEDSTGAVPVELTLTVDGKPVEAPKYKAIGDYTDGLMYTPLSAQDTDNSGDKASGSGGGDSSSNTAVVISVVAGGLGAIVVAGLLVWWYRNRRTS